MELKNYTTNEVRDFIKQTPRDFSFAIFYPESIFELYREVSFLNKQIQQTIQNENKTFKMAEQAFKGFEKGYNKFLSFKDKAYQFSYQNDDFGSYEDLIGELLSKKVLLPLTAEDRQLYSSFFNPLANRDILFSDEAFRNLSRTLKINFEDKYKVLFTRIDLKPLFESKDKGIDKDYPQIGFDFIAEVGELTLYPDGQLYQGLKPIYHIDKHQGVMFEFVKYIMENQRGIGNSHISKDSLRKEFVQSLTDLVNNTNKRLKEGKCKYLIRRNKKTNTVYIGYSQEWLVSSLEK